VEIEATERAFLQGPETAELIDALRAKGFSVAIDDFGTGYSSLSKLATLPVDRIKIDRAFIGEIKRASDEAPLVAAMIALAHRLNLQVTAEGVETAEQLAYLDRNECDLFQGYLVSQPLDPASLRDLLVARRN
jgi:EAL domain-containing protein (putative c-di-GMP-specific phosphodiesterase class I)